MDRLVLGSEIPAMLPLLLKTVQPVIVLRFLNEAQIARPRVTLASLSLGRAHAMRTAF
jgi:hypothetical protein